MKKTLSFILVAAMLLCMIPAFSLFAAEDALATIDTPDELVALAEAANAAGRDYKVGQTIKVTANLDMTGKTYTPIKQGLFALDFDGHTLSNLNVTIDNAPADVGLLAYRLENGAGNGLITNLKIKDCSLTVNGNGSVRAGIVGYADRANVTNVDIDGFTITSSAGGYVGTLMGGKAWGYQSDIKATIKNVTIDAPYATVGVIVGMTEGSDSFNVTELDSSITVKNSINDVADNTYLGSGDKLVYSEGLKSTVVDEVDGKRPDYAADYATIDSPAELAELTKLANKGVAFSGTIKISKDLDMKDITDFQPINRLAFSIDFDGHTISNLVVNTDGFEGFAGLLVCRTNNHCAINNASFKNCELNTNKVTNVGAVMGLGDRSVATGTVKLEKVTVNATGATKVGGVYGERWWATTEYPGVNAEHPADLAVEMTDVVFNVDGATQVGLVAGLIDGSDNTLLNLTSLKAENVDINNNAEGFDASKVTFAGTNNGGEKVTVAEDKIEIKLADNVVGYEKPVEPADPDNNTQTPDTTTKAPDNTTKAPETTKAPTTGNPNNNAKDPAKTGDSLIVATAIVMVVLAGAVIISKKRNVA